MIRPFLAAAAIAVAGLSSALAQDYPAKPVTLVVPFAPGGSSDVISRFVGQKLSEAWKQSVIVDNKAGGAGQIAMQAVARSAPDGYTLILGHIGTLAVNPSMFAKLSYDYKKEFVPVAMLAVVPSAIAVNPSLPINNVKDLTGYSKANPGKLNADINKVPADPEIQKRLADDGAEAGTGSSGDFGKYIDAEEVRWGKVVKKAGIKPD